MSTAKAIMYGVAACYCLVISLALIVGDLPHGWNLLFPVGVIFGWIEITVGVVCGGFLFYMAGVED